VKPIGYSESNLRQAVSRNTISSQLQKNFRTLFTSLHKFSASRTLQLKLTKVKEILRDLSDTPNRYP